MSSADITMHVQSHSRASAYMDGLQMLSGASLVLFMWAHLIMVSSVLLGPHVMNALARFFESTYLVHTGGPLIFIVFLIHFALAARKVPLYTQDQRVIWQQARMLQHQDTWLWLVQVGTAMLILVMGSIHMWEVLTDLPITAAKSAERVQTGSWLIFYLFLLPIVELHVGIGFYRIWVKWGFIKNKNRAKLKKVEHALTGFFILIGLLTLLRFLLLKV